MASGRPASFFSLTRTALTSAAGNLTSSWVLFFQSLATTLYAIVASGAVQRSIYDKLAESISVLDFGAIGDDVVDDTAAVQAAINYAQANRCAIYFPPGVYKITGDGLSVTSGNPSFYGAMSIGLGAPVLKYYGTDTCLTVGNGTNRIFAVNLYRISVQAADGVTAARGVLFQNFSEGEWLGLSVIGAGTGIFEVGIQFIDTGLLNFQRLTMELDSYAAGTTALLFDSAVSFGNSNITMDVLDVTNFEVGTTICSLGASFAQNYYFENCGTAVAVDNTSKTTAIQQVIFRDGQVNTSGTGAPQHLVLTVNAAAAQAIQLEHLQFIGSSFFLSGGISKPMQMTLSSTMQNYPFSKIGIYTEDCVFVGAVDAVMDIANPGGARCLVSFKGNYAYDNTALVRVPDLTPSSIATVIEYTPVNSIGQLLNWLDPTGANFLGGSSGSSMTRPAASISGPGRITGVSVAALGNDDGFIAVGAGGGATPSAYYTRWEISGFNSNTDMDRTLVAKVGNTEIARIDANGLGLGGQAGRLAAIYKASASLTFSAPAAVPGSCPALTVTVAGAQVGDIALFSPSLATGFAADASVTAANTVTIQFSQFSGAAAVPFAAGTSFTVIVLRFN